MTLLVLGLILWTLVHVFKRVAPDARAGMDRAMDAGPAKGVIAALLLLAVLMTLVVVLWRTFRRATMRLRPGRPAGG